MIEADPTAYVYIASSMLADFVASGHVGSHCLRVALAPSRSCMACLGSKYVVLHLMFSSVLQLSPAFSSLLELQIGYRQVG